MLAGACLLALVFTITECKLTLDIIKRQDDSDCGDPSNLSTNIGICTQADFAGDMDALCDNNCMEVYEDFYECAGIENDAQLKEFCGSEGGGDAEGGSTAAVEATLLSIISAVVVALAVTLN